MAVRKTKKGAALKRWFKEKWTDEKGNPCGSKNAPNTPCLLYTSDAADE